MCVSLPAMRAAARLSSHLRPATMLRGAVPPTWQLLCRAPPPPPCSSASIVMTFSNSTPQPAVMTDQHADKRGDLPRREVAMDDVTVRYARSGGPGGQNVNKLVSVALARLPADPSCRAVHWSAVCLPCQHRGPTRVTIGATRRGHTEYQGGHALRCPWG